MDIKNSVSAMEDCVFSLDFIYLFFAHNSEEHNYLEPGKRQRKSYIYESYAFYLMIVCF